MARASASRARARESREANVSLTPSTALVTGSSGLVGSEMVATLDGEGWAVHGLDNNMRRDFFGPDGDTTANRDRLLSEYHALPAPRARRPRSGARAAGSSTRCGRASSSTAPRSLLTTWRRDARSTTSRSTRPGRSTCSRRRARSCPESPFVFLSTNKVYGDSPNELDLVELETRYDYADPDQRDGIDETCRIDATTHSLFGASKAAADLLVQEYGRYFGMPTVCFRGGCLTGLESRECGAPRVPRLPRTVPARGPHVPHLRLQGKAGQGQPPRVRRVRGGTRLRREASAGLRLQPGRRPRQLRLDPRGDRAARSAHRRDARCRIRRRAAPWRPHLLHQRPRSAARRTIRAGT